MWIRHTPRLPAATASRAPGARNARTSLTRCAPAAPARRMTSGSEVSTDSSSGKRAATRSMTGSTRRSCSSPATAAAPGRVDSPPMSMIAAPSAAMRSACASAASGSRKRPPSENESGVTFSTPMTTGRSSSSTRPAQRICNGGPSYLRPAGARDSTNRAVNARRDQGIGRIFNNKNAPYTLISLSAGLCLVLSRGTHDAVGRSARRCDRRLAAASGRRGVVPAFRWLGRAAGHDVPDLVIGQRLVLDKRLGHGVQLVQVGLQDLARALVIHLDHAPHFLVNRMCGFIRHLLVLGHAAAEEHLALVFRIGQRSEPV